MLSYSRGALLALAIGLAIWFAAVPLRLRGGRRARRLGARRRRPWSAGRSPRTALTGTGAPMAARADAGHELGRAAAADGRRAARRRAGRRLHAAKRPPDPADAAPRRARLLVALALVPVAGLIVLAAAPGGIDGQMSKAWDQLTDPDGAHARQHARPAHRDGVRARALLGRGDRRCTPTAPWSAPARAPTRSPARASGRATLDVRHAHGYVVQTLADLGWVGLGLSLLAALAWLAERGAPLGLRRARPRAALRRRARRAVRRSPRWC